jgi:hypothetical protein
MSVTQEKSDKTSTIVHEYVLREEPMSVTEEKSDKTSTIVHEYVLREEPMSVTEEKSDKPVHGYVLCRVFLNGVSIRI